MARRRSRRYSLASIVVLLVALSVQQYADTGTLQWPGELKTAIERLLAQTPQQSLPSQPSQSSSSAPPAAPGELPVPASTQDGLLAGIATRITDGDTFTLRYGSLEEERVRLHGIDAPERDQPHGRAAGTALVQLIENRDVRVQFVDRDNYGRLVARVWVDDTEVNLALVQGGHAWWYEYYAQDRRDLELAEEAARRAGLGLWADAAAVAPWDWRRGQR